MAQKQRVLNEQTGEWLYPEDQPESDVAAPSAGVNPTAPATNRSTNGTGFGGSTPYDYSQPLNFPPNDQIVDDIFFSGAAVPSVPGDPTSPLVNYNSGGRPNPPTNGQIAAQQTAPSSSVPSVNVGGGGGGSASVAGPSNAPAFNGALFDPVVAPAQNSPLDQAYQAAIMKLLGTPQDIDAAELAKSPENRAFRLAQQRAEERNKAQLAEEASAEGWSDSGGFDSAVQGIRQNRGEAESGFLGQLANTKLQQNRDLLVQAIQFATSTGQFSAAQQMQAALANLDAKFKQSSLAENARQFDLGLGFDYTNLGVNANQAATNALLG